MKTELEKTIELAESMGEWVEALLGLLVPYMRKQWQGEPVTPEETALLRDALEANTAILAAYREWQASRP